MNPVIVIPTYWSENNGLSDIGEIGTYDHMKNPAAIKIDMERAKYWISCGAQPTDTVRGLLKAAEAAQPKAEEAAPEQAE